MADILVGSAVAALLAGALRRPLAEMLTRASAVRPNYAGKPIPVAMGLLFVLASLGGLTGQAVTSATLTWLAGTGWAVNPGLGLGFPFQASAFTIASFGLLGLIDDLLGSRESSGFAGHFRRLFGRGELTTGALKALAGGAAAALLAFSRGGGPGDAVLNIVLIALTANLINLLDLRPGRALKAFTALLVVVFIGAAGRGWALQLLPLAAATWVYAPTDLAGRGMMGDSGSNVLGASLGVAVAFGWDLWPRIAWLAGLVAIHLYAERYSISETIERVAVLRRLDRMGRGGEEPGGREG